MVALHTERFFPFLLLVVADVLLERLVEFQDPAFDAAEMVWLVALLAIPNRAALVNWILADKALLLALGESLNQEYALLG